MQQRDCSLHPLHPDQLLGQYWRGLHGAAPGHRHPRLVPGQPPGRGGQESGVLQPSHRDQCSALQILWLLWVSFDLSNSASQDVSAACTCYAAAATLVEETKLLKCSAKESFNTVKASKSNCLDKFSVGFKIKQDQF